jgi:hypothetical protein
VFLEKGQQLTSSGTIVKHLLFAEGVLYLLLRRAVEPLSRGGALSRRLIGDDLAAKLKSMPPLLELQ